MSGHSKWKNNLSRKTAQDKKRAGNFQKLSKSITVAVIDGGSPDPAFNPRLRVMIEKARSESMPKDNIDRAIAKGSGPDKATMTRLVLETFGPCGSLLIVIATTDNQNRTLTDLKNLIERSGAKLGAQGSVTPLFTHCAQVIITKPSHEHEETLLTLAEALHADDLQSDDEHTIIYFPYTMLHQSHSILEKTPFEIVHPPEATYKPLAPIDVTDNQAEKIHAFIEMIEEHDDVENVFVNLA
ncbi:MAG: YebC/PmpR family DNA-binding transcriptional regulator [Candidatus Roizmanbacteria bacterium]